MSIITIVVKLNEKNMRTVNTPKGEKQVVSSPIIKDSSGSWVYASAFIPFAVSHGDVLTISGRIEQKEEGEYKNNKFVYPTVERLYQPQSGNQQTAQAEQFGGSPAEISDEDLPF